MNHYKLYRTRPDENGLRFAVLHRMKRRARTLNFWRVTSEHTFWYAFKPNQRFNTKTRWSVSLCKELDAELRSPSPNVTVVGFAIDRTVYFSDSGLKRPPKAPSCPKKPNRRKRSKRRREIEKALSEIPAPYILYGKHDEFGKEYAWKLTPDKPKRQGIFPGDRVLVWTYRGFASVTVTRIEPAGDKEQPKARVKKKLKSVLVDS